MRAFRSSLGSSLAWAARWATTLAFISTAGTPAWSWQTAHGHTDNGGFVDVATAAAKAPLVTIPRLGGIGAGAGPVVAPNGTVYVGNARGKLMSFSADGTPGWSIDLGSGAILASPALSGEGSIYVVSTMTVRDHAFSPPRLQTITNLHKVNSAGVEIWRKALPRVYGGLIGSAPPNVWNFNGSEVVLVPSVFRQEGGLFEAHLTAFSLFGDLLADTKIGSLFGDVTGEWGDLYTFSAPEPTPVERTVNDLPEKIIYPFPAAAIYAPAPHVEPKIFVTDGYRDVVGYTFNGNFKEFYREKLTNTYVLSTPMAWIDGHAVLSIGGGSKLPEVFFAAPAQTSRIRGPYSIAAPTQLSGGRIAFVGYSGDLTVMRNGTQERFVRLPGQSMASAAASRTHLYVSTASALHVLDVQSIEEVAKIDWVRGGMSPPAIGPLGHVYAIADDALYVFAPPAKSSATSDAGPLGGGIFAQREPQLSAAKQTQSFAPPLTGTNKRLFACEERDGDNCGKSTNQRVALAFCQAQGFASVGALDTDTRKVAAETLGGESCSKKKCKVFDEIVCNK